MNEKQIWNIYTVCDPLPCFYHLLEEKPFQITVPSCTQFGSIYLPLWIKKECCFFCSGFYLSHLAPLSETGHYFPSFIVDHLIAFPFLSFQTPVSFHILTNPQSDLFVFPKSYVFFNYWMQIKSAIFFHNSAFRNFHATNN